MTLLGLLPAQPTGLTGTAASATPSGAAGTDAGTGAAARGLPPGLAQLLGVDDVAELTADGGWSPEFLAVLQQLLGSGMPLPEAGAPLPAIPAASPGGVSGGPAWLEQLGLDGQDGNEARLAALAETLEGLEPTPKLAASLAVAENFDALLGKVADKGGVSLPAGLSALLATQGPAVPQGQSLPGQAVAATAVQTPLALAQPIGSPDWQQALGERMLWLAGREQQVAELRLNPPHLGPLEVRIQVHQDQASVAFVSQHAAVREALEQAVPRLREMLGQQDLQLVQVDVGDRQAPDRQPAASHGGSAAGYSGGGEAGAAGEPVAPATTLGRWARGLVDLFA